MPKSLGQQVSYTNSKKNLPLDTLKLIHYSIVHPHLQYCNVIWGNTSKSHLAPLERLQKKAIRNICRAGYLEHTNLLFKSLLVLKLKEINSLETIKFVKKENHKPNSPYFTSRERFRDIALRNIDNQSLHVPRPRSEREKKLSLIMVQCYGMLYLRILGQLEILQPSK